MKRAIPFYLILLLGLPSLVPAKEIILSSTMRKQLNTFFSNFSEAWVPPFQKGKMPNSTLIQFGIMHNVINNRKLIHELRDGNGALTRQYVEQSVKKYFGNAKIVHGTIPGYRYTNGQYTFPLGDGEELRFAQLTKLVDLGNQHFRASVNEYIAPNHFEDVHALENEWKRLPEDERPILRAIMSATINKVTEKGKSRYILIEYVQVKTFE